MKTPLVAEVDLGPGHIVLEGVILLRRLADYQDKTRQDGVAAPREGGTASSPLFGPCLLWQLSPISATAELLYFCTVWRYAKFHRVWRERIKWPLGDLALCKCP